MSYKNQEKTLKFLRGMTLPTDPSFDGQPFDIVIPIMGPTGVGKSTFINSLLDSSQTQVTVENGLKSCTSRMDPVVIPFSPKGNGFTNPNGNNKGRLVLVDTPGFDNTYVDDAEVLRRISVWLGISYATDMKLGGVIYLHDITQTRMMSTSSHNLNMFRKLVGADAAEFVVLGTTKWSLVQPQAGAQREVQLKSEFWKDMIDAGSQVVSVHTQDTPREIVNSILNRVKITKSKTDLLMIQHELGQKRLSIPETEAGQTLKHWVDELVQVRKRKLGDLKGEDFEKEQQELQNLLKMANDLTMPLGARIKRFFV